MRPLAILAVAAAVAAVMIKSRPELEARNVATPPPLVAVQPVTLATVPVTVIAHGNVTAWRELTLTAQVAGRILWKAPTFEPGVVVEAGEPLLRIDRTDYELALAEARRDLASAELALADAKALRQSARIDEAEATVAAARARIARAERDLVNTELSAPYRAVIDEQAVELGQFISAGTNVGRILGADRAEIRLPVPPQDVAFINGGEETAVMLFAEGATDEARWTGRLKRIEARVDRDTRVIPVVVEVADPLDRSRHRQPLPFGLFVRAEIPGRAVQGAVELPQAALHGDDVFLFADGALERRAITVARLSNGRALVTDGLATGDRVVTTRLELMFDGMAVAPLDD
ncbi:efflux RND transporter periplasmic adaptor subunit [Pseudohaliea rubra]|uniref:Membrane fusion protein of RND family multidrug efflux pump n=1 Tax=Pseudohaliea rubra DSM 19751 TaxID=1265313 RepID=A0A095VTC7_9GAMM|nr:efflux RND transporter periplasmic adaptor subunit [Pseudohaliea rubra]KGE04353.1 Membrane fusion protein of RND family multidrug efflux pump [Pseudohaliea rubra DSM 19751]